MTTQPRGGGTKPPTGKSGVARTLDALRKAADATLGAGVVRTLNTHVERWYDTCLAPLNVVLTGNATKGIAAGRITEIFGCESVGKTTLGCTMLAHVQQHGGIGGVIDTERTLTQGRAAQLGVNVNDLLYIQASFVEPILDALILLVTKSKQTPCLFFWDTLAGTRTLAERNASVEESKSIASHARSLSIGMRHLGEPLSQSASAVVVCNQLKVGSIGNPFATERDKDATLGGGALKFHAGSRVKLEYARRISGVRNNKTVDIGFEVNAKVVKSKDGPFGARCILVFLMENQGRFNDALSCLRTLQLWGVAGKGKTIEVAGAKLTETAFRAKYETDAQFREKIHKLLETRYATLYAGVTAARKAAPIQNLTDEEEQ